MGSWKVIGIFRLVDENAYKYIHLFHFIVRLYFNDDYLTVSSFTAGKNNRRIFFYFFNRHYDYSFTMHINIMCR